MQVLVTALTAEAWIALAHLGTAVVGCAVQVLRYRDRRARRRRRAARRRSR